MPDTSTQSRVPPHLRHLLVQQAYEHYTAIDQAVWRFVLLQAHARLVHHAHPAYARGLGQAGISVESIPRIEFMDQSLAASGWGAVAVDGFIPPRAFQELQSLSILPIAADMRTAAHLVYTPAPDIIHEAAGHAPILSEATYAGFLRLIGAAGAGAFTSPADARVDAAIHSLSEVKELGDATPEQLRRAEHSLRQARAALGRPSEAARLSRLYWWTAEYGLVGTPQDYRLYGAGLLSSLWESVACHSPEVPKLPLTAQVVDVDYDITRPQPQLFVTPDFGALHETLAEVVRRLPSQRGGEEAVAEALAAEELATFTLEGGLTLVGQLSSRQVAHGKSAILRFCGRTRVGRDAQAAEPKELYLLLGRLASTVAPKAGVAELEMESGARLSAKLTRVGHEADAWWLEVSSGTLEFAGERQPLAPGALVLVTGAVTGARAGAESSFYPATLPPSTRVPRPHARAPREQALMLLYEQALGVLHAGLGSAVVPVFERLHRELRRDFPDDWLLPWNLLESLLKLRFDGALAEDLRADLERLEIRYLHRQPIASGLRYLAEVVGVRG